MSSVPISYYGKLFDSPDITPAIAKAANIAKTYGLALVKARTPVDTGDLKSHWQAKLEGNGIRFKNEMFYAGWVEFGTKKMAPRSMLTSSMPDIQDVFIDSLYNEIGDQLAGDIIADYTKANYSTAVTATDPAKYPHVGSKTQSKIKTGLTKRDPKTAKSYLFSSPSDILNKTQLKKISNARPLLQRGQR
jgi:Bacteriophage HK97-gp10, putative tail-component